MIKNLEFANTLRCDKEKSMDKRDWLDYFEAINEREPSDEEINQARANGDFQEDDVHSVTAQIDDKKNNEVNVAFEDSIKKDKQQYPFNREITSVTNLDMNKKQFKLEVKEYFYWFLSQLKKPQYYTQESYFMNGLITLIISAILLAWGVVNCFRRFLFMLLNLSISGESLQTQSPERYHYLRQIVNSYFSISNGFILAITIFVIYAIILMLPYGISKFANEHKSFKNEMGKMMSFTPLLLIINAIAFLISFMIKTSFIISEKKLGSLFGSSTTLPFGNFDWFNDITKSVPAVASVKTVVIYFSILTILGLILLVIQFIKNSHYGIGVLSPFYVTLIGMIFIYVIYFMAGKFILSTIVDAVLEGFKGISGI